jgi:hypothetical protein
MLLLAVSKLIERYKAGALLPGIVPVWSIPPSATYPFRCPVFMGIPCKEFHDLVKIVRQDDFRGIRRMGFVGHGLHQNSRDIILYGKALEAFEPEQNRRKILD